MENLPTVKISGIFTISILHLDQWVPAQSNQTQLNSNFYKFSDKIFRSNYYTLKVLQAPTQSHLA